MKPATQPSGGDPDAGAEPAELYAAGRRYAARVATLRAERPTRRTAVSLTALEVGATPAAVRRAVAFAAAVDALAATAGSGAKSLILGGHPRLPVSVVMRVSRTHADRQRFALAQAAAGRDPFGKPSAGTAPPFDTHDPAEVLNRLARNAGAVSAVARGFSSAPVETWPAGQKVTAIRGHARAIRGACDRMRELVSAGAGATRRVARSHRPAARPATARRPTPLKDALGAVARAAGVTAKNLRDLPRVLVDTPPTPTERAALLERIRALAAAAAGLTAALDTRA